MEAHDRTLYETSLVKIGAFRCARKHVAFENSGPIENYCFVFPRTAVVIEHDHDRPFVANPNIVTFYNRGDEYRRQAIANDGDRCDWFALRHDIVVDIARSVAPAAESRAEHPFQLTHALSDPRTYVFQRQLFGMISRGVPAETLAIEESVIWLLERVLRSAHEQRGEASSRDERQRHTDLVHDAKTLLSKEFTRGMTLARVTHMLGVSAFHLCRVFHRHVGCTLHEYRHQLRLRCSLEPLVAGPSRALVQCALDAGFSSHSHYGSAFKRAFGQTPSDFVRQAAGDAPGALVANDRISQLFERFYADRGSL